MIVDELIALLNLGKLEVNDMTYFYSLSSPINAESIKAGRIHLYLWKATDFFKKKWKIEEPYSDEILYEGPRGKELNDEIVRFIKMSKQEQADHARETVKRVLNGHFDKIINDYSDERFKK